MIDTWDESLETGDESIDRQHREVIRLVDELETVERAENASRAPMYQALGRVMDFTVEHFMMEEALMQRVEYPQDLTEHMIAQHAEFTAYARLRVLEFRSSDTDTLEPLSEFLRDWLVGHEFGLDRTLADWIRRREDELESVKLS